MPVMVLPRQPLCSFVVVASRRSLRNARGRIDPASRLPARAKMPLWNRVAGVTAAVPQVLCATPDFGLWLTDIHVRHGPSLHQATSCAIHVK